MLLRPWFTIVTLAGLAVYSSASIVSYRVTGTFDDAVEDYSALLGTNFEYTFSYDTDTPNLGDANAAVYALDSTTIVTDLGTQTGTGMASIDLDPQFGSMNFVGEALSEDEAVQGYGIFFSDMPPQSGNLPTDLVDLSQTYPPTFFMGSGTIGGFSYASASVVNVQAVPEPASMAALAVGAAALLRRRRAA